MVSLICFLLYWTGNKHLRCWMFLIAISKELFKTKLILLPSVVDCTCWTWLPAVLGSLIAMVVSRLLYNKHNNILEGYILKENRLLWDQIQTSRLLRAFAFLVVMNMPTSKLENTCVHSNGRTNSCLTQAHRQKSSTKSLILSVHPLTGKCNKPSWITDYRFWLKLSHLPRRFGNKVPKL